MVALACPPERAGHVMCVRNKKDHCSCPAERAVAILHSHETISVMPLQPDGIRPHRRSARVGRGHFKRAQMMIGVALTTPLPITSCWVNGPRSTNLQLFAAPVQCESCGAVEQVAVVLLRRRPWYSAFAVARVSLRFLHTVWFLVICAVRIRSSGSGVVILFLYRHSHARCVCRRAQHGLEFGCVCLVGPGQPARRP